MSTRHVQSVIKLAAMLICGSLAVAPAQQVPPAPTIPVPVPKADPVKPEFEIYGAAQLDLIGDFNRVNPDWEAALRPSQIPTQPGLYGQNGHTLLSARQSRFGVHGELPTKAGLIRATFEFDLFGVGSFAGETTFRLRHAYGEWKQVLAGQTWSLFMNMDVFPNVIDYWGPNGMVLLRNPQIRWTPISGGNTIVAVAVESPNSDIDTGIFSRLAPGFSENAIPRNTIPDFTGLYRRNTSWGHFQASGVVGRIGFETKATPDNRPKGNDTRWGINLSSNIKTTGNGDRIILQAVYGRGIANYMNDGGNDLGPQLSRQGQDLRFEAVPLLGLVAYYDHFWSKRWSTSLGYARTQVNNRNLQSSDDFRNAQYASANLLYSIDSFLTGVEYLWGQREDLGGAKGHDNRVQITVKYSFAFNR